MAGKTSCAKCTLDMNINSKSENPMQCQICELYFHATCQGIGQSNIYKFIVNCQNLIWLCEYCKDKSHDFVEGWKEISKIRQILDSVTKKLELHDLELNKRSSIALHSDIFSSQKHLKDH